MAAVSRGEAFLLQGGDCAETFAEVTADNVRNKLRGAAPDGGRPDLRRLRAGGEARPARRPVRQAALLGPRDPRRRDPAGVPRRRGQRLRLHPGVADPGPAAGCSTSTTPRPRPSTWCARFVTGGYADLRQVHTWNTDFVKESAVGQHYEAMAGEIDKALAFMSADRRRPRRAQARRLPLQPRGAAAGVRARDDAHRLAHRQRLQRLGPLRVDRRADPAARRRARRVLPPHRQPDRLQARPDRDRGRRDRAGRAAQPRERGRPADVHHPLRRRQDPRRAARAGREGHRRRRRRSRGSATRCTATPSSRAPATRPAASTTSSTRCRASSTCTARSAPGPAASSSR